MARWYIIHAYSGFENKVRDQILSEAERIGLSQLVEAVEVPTEQVTEVRRGKKIRPSANSSPAMCSPSST
jgi:transcriptional antiterminator NusG